MELYAETAKKYMAMTGTTARHFAQVVVDSRYHASLNPKAQFRVTTSVDEVLAAREVASPLTVPMCSPVGDGAAAVVVASERWARSKGLEFVRVLSTVLLSGHDDADGPSATQHAARLAYERAGVGPEDVNIVELHDAAAPAFLTLLEELALCHDGEASRLIDERATVLGGRLPVNISGGLLSKGHPIGATGCAQLVELCDQLRGRAGDRQADGLQIALAENAGGSIGDGPAAAVVTVLGR
jgi:acetyl-CoA acetyltransferase